MIKGIIRWTGAADLDNWPLYAAKVFMAFFAIMNPIANTAIFIGLTRGDDAATWKAVARRSLLLTFVITTIVSVCGKLIFIIGLHMLQVSSSSVHKPSDADLKASRDAQLAVAVSPLAIPLMAAD